MINHSKTVEAVVNYNSRLLKNIVLLFELNNVLTVQCERTEQKITESREKK